MSAISLVIIVIFISAGTSAYFYFQSEREDRGQKTSGQEVAADETLTRLEKELKTVLNLSTGINSERYNEIDRQLKELELRGASEEKLELVRSLLSKFKIGGLASPIPSGLVKEEAPIVIHQATPTSVPTVQQPTPTLPTDAGLTPIPSIPTQTPVFSATPASAPSCESNPSPVFTSHITDISKVNYVVSPPTMGAGPSLKPHSYIGTDHARVPVYAPVAMTLESGAHYVGGPYTLDFKVSCEVKIRFGHITEPVNAIKELLPSEPKESSQTQGLTPVKFAAGDLIAYTTGTSQAGNWDFGVYNSTTSNRYANDPDWNWSDIITSAVCPFEYFTNNLKTAYVSKFNPTILGGNPPHGESFCSVSTGGSY